MRKLNFLFIAIFTFVVGSFSQENLAKQIVSKMSVDEKIGQMTLVDNSYLRPYDDITRYYLGGILSGGNSFPFNDERRAKPQDWAEYIELLQSYALKTRLKIPLIYGVDAVHGNQKVFGATIFPHNVGLGATKNAALVEKIAEITAKECSAVGINWAYAPCVAVARDDRWGRQYESFSESPEIVALLGEASIKGFQNGKYPLGVAACAKHYLGDGGTMFGTGMNRKLDRGNTVASEEEIRAIHLFPYTVAVSNGVKTIMASFSKLNGEFMHQNAQYIDGVLKKELGFKGFVVSDWKAIDELPGRYEDAVRNVIMAGVDMVMVPDDYEKFINTMKRLISQKKIPMERIDDAVERIIRVKIELGLFENPLPQKENIKLIGSKEHKEIARQAVRESIVLLKNENKTLPISKEARHILVIGDKADSVGHQCGGWTLYWGGGVKDVVPGCSILSAIKSAVSKNTKVTYSRVADDISNIREKIDVCIVVVGENPYVEFNGDVENLNLSRKDTDIIKRVSQLKVPKVLIILSGRPVIITEYIPSFSSVVAAWWFGTEAEGLTDILFGDYKPTGKLPFSWPKDNSQLPLNVGDTNYDPLFPFGYGLTY